MESDFQRMQREATQRLREMSARSVQEEKTPPEPLPPEKKTQIKNNNPMDILTSLFSSGSSDGLLLAGILLLLYRDKGDNLLMLALLYILM